jgi:hypothetical protein
MPITLALLSLFLFGCDDSMPAAARNITVSLHPALPVGGSQNFTADVTNAKARAHRAGVYSAPGVPGTIHVLAARQVDATTQASAAVTNPITLKYGERQAKEFAP